MIHVSTRYNLRDHHTFGTEASCRAYAAPANEDEIEFLLEYSENHRLPRLILGEGSNLLFIRDYEGLVIQPVIKGVEVLDESDHDVLVRVGAGENWDNFTQKCVENGWYGPENLALIPGTVGSAPVQNIGAYGIEVRELIDQVEVMDTRNGSTRQLANAECQFGYRSSIFKHAEKGRFIVTRVVFRLGKKGGFNLDYGNVREEFEKSGDPSLASMRNTIVRIRESKLPDVGTYGNAGSFFKNPVISDEAFSELQETDETVPRYPAKGGIKVPAAWLIDRCKLKGLRTGNVGTWPKQPLVIINYGGATGMEIFEFSEMIRECVLKTFGIGLEREVQVIGLQADQSME